MLVLSRKAGEEIHIGDDIIVKVTRLQGGRVQIGIEAPRNIVVSRGDSVEPTRVGKAGAQHSSALR